MSATTLSSPTTSSRTRRGADDGATNEARPEQRTRRLPGALAVLWTVLGLLLIVALGALVIGPGRGLRSDIAAQRGTVAAQLETTRAQLRVTEQQLALTAEQLEITKDQRRIALEQLDLAQAQLGVARGQLSRTEESVELQRRLATIADQTLQQAREINDKTPDAQATDTGPVTGR